MNKDLYRWICELVRKNPAETTERPYSITGRKVQEKYQCGHSRNGKLVFTAEDKRALRILVKDKFDLDPFVDDLPDRRTDVARLHNNEKLARKPASHDHVLLNCPAGKLRLNGRHIDLQAPFIVSAGLTTLASAITEIDHAKLVVVENLEIMSRCAEFIMPAALHEALWIYRGDSATGARVDACHDLLRRHVAGKTVIAFSDMDPKGLEIALTMPAASHWLGPDRSMWASCLKSKYASRSGFDAQGETMAYLLSNNKTGLSTELAALIAELCDERSSFRQEHMLAHAVPLALYPLR
ncbi:DUF7281 domain-containing protein [Methylobacter sp. YRD-M1]|uniref:DUF7281 domain-containing protein n=1 Tax=Methylobacter sp. YRD-M1 TaxID=2911520 RepID=UPI00227CDF10|nr:hypothetical protein [Methylobacter sp. YRD-M1]WAK02438.1 hypothetical protein LZ558_01235 [Methylobacter sp. YRD-M1]